MPRFSTLLTVVALVVLGLASRADVAGRRAGRCSLDGVALGPRAVVELVQDGAVLARFCCVTCARDWPAPPSGAWWRVHDELTGAPLDARHALFVESRVPTARARRDHVHTFGALADALAHAREFGGALVEPPLPTPGVDAPNDPSPATR